MINYVNLLILAMILFFLPLFVKKIILICNNGEYKGLMQSQGYRELFNIQWEDVIIQLT